MLRVDQYTSTVTVRINPECYDPYGSCGSQNSRTVREELLTICKLHLISATWDIFEAREDDKRFVDPHSSYRCSEYGLLTMLTVCTDRAFRQLLSTVRNSEAVLEMTDNARQFFYLKWLY